MPEGTLLVEVSWEVCQQIGGIYTVVQSKIPRMMEQWGDRVCLVGPFNPDVSPVEFEETSPNGLFGAAAEALREAGVEVHYGRWLTSGHPPVILLNPASAMPRLNEIKHRIWQRHGIDMRATSPLIDQVVAFGALVEQFFAVLTSRESPRHAIIGHFHEWMGGAALPDIRHAELPVALVLTTHATQLGRFLSMDNPCYYDAIPSIDWSSEARRFNIEVEAGLERAAAKAAHVLTTVSDITAVECVHFLNRTPDVILPNGRIFERFAVLHEFQNLHRRHKERIHQFVTSLFFPSYTFDLNRTLYVFTSGRYEYGNKGFDVCIEAMRRLNARMKDAKLDRTVVFFLVTRAAFRGINAEVLRARGVMEEIRRDCTEIQEQMGHRLFNAVAMHKWPRFDDLIDEYWRLRLRRALHAWHTERLPPVVTHDLAYPNDDAVRNHIRAAGFANRAEDPVKIIYHPDFISANEPLIGLDYDQFVRGCHLGVFPCRYEPWGYAPLECVLLGIPTIASDLAGFGLYVREHIPDHEKRGIWVLNRRGVSETDTADELAAHIFEFAQLDQRARITLRNRVESMGEKFDWGVLYPAYNRAHELALERFAGEFALGLDTGSS